jgi:hypothetical protein
MSDLYAFWRAGLAGIVGAVHDGCPQPGFYRMRKTRGGPWLPVAIWFDDDGSALCFVSDEPRKSADVWLSCARFPVTEEDYRHAVDTGEWPGALPEPTAEDGPAKMGDNQPPADPAAAVIEALDESVAQAKSWLQGREIVSQADADRCEAFIARLSRAGKEAETAHRTEKQPHLEAGRAVDARWKPIIDSASGAVRMLKGALTPFLRAREAEKKAEAAQAIAAGADVARADITARTSGTHGRKVSLRTRKRAVVRDYEAALQFFASHPEVQALVQRLADKVAAVGGTVPGVEIVIEKEAA